MAFSQLTVMGNEKEKDISNLQSNTTYAIRVFARSDNDGNGSKSDEITATILCKGFVFLVFL